jgi:hypothetical protein
MLHKGLLVVAVAMMIGVGVYANSLVINEVAWAGTAASPTDEWIELFNPTDQPVNLAGWMLSFGDVVIDLGAGVETAVAPGGYFLLERTNDDTVSDVAADLIYTGSLSNDGAVLYLTDPSGKTADTANADHDGWIAGSASSGPVAYATMERVDPAGPDDETNWKTNNGLNVCGEDADGQALNATPGQENSATIARETFPTVAITSPSPDTSTVQGDVAIAWRADDPDGASGELLPIDIYLSSDGGQSFSPLVKNLVGDSYVWNTESVDNGDQYLLKVVATDDDGNMGVAISPIFSISNSG